VRSAQLRLRTRPEAWARGETSVHSGSRSSLDGKLERQGGFEPGTGFRFHQPGGRIEAYEEVAIRVDVLQRVIESAKSHRNADRAAEIEGMEIGVSEGKRSARAKAKIDGIKNRRLAAVAWSDQTV